MENCSRCGKEITTNKHGRTRYCRDCRVLVHRENSRRYNARHRDPNKPRSIKRCHHVDWSVADPMIDQGITDEMIAQRCGCAPLTITGRRYKLARIAKNPVLSQDPIFTYFNYKERLDAWLREVHPRAFRDMTFEDLRAWLKTSQGQDFLQRANRNIEAERFTERTQIDSLG